MLGVGTDVIVWNYPNIPMKANRNQNGVKLTVSKLGTHEMVWVVTNYGK